MLMTVKKKKKKVKINEDNDLADSYVNEKKGNIIG